MNQEQEKNCNAEKNNEEEKNGNQVEGNEMNENSIKEKKVNQDQFISDFKIEGQTILQIPEEFIYQNQVENLTYIRRNRWGDRKLKKTKVHQDVVFNPSDGFLNITKQLAITSGQHPKAKLPSFYQDIKKKSHWGQPHQKTFQPPALNYISPRLCLDQVLDSINKIMGLNIPQDQDIRSPSPDPIFDKEGIRINTRQLRKKEALIRQRNNIIEDCIKMRKTFKPPPDYKKQMKQKKIYLSQQALSDPTANYIGKIIGPGGQTQKLLQKRSNAKISIRGKGAGGSQRNTLEAYDNLHVLVQGHIDEQVQAGCKLVEKILTGQIDEQFKIEQQRQIEIMRGIYNDNYCENCGETGHRTWTCKNKIGFQKSVVKCGICDEVTHPTCDCPNKVPISQIQKNSLQLQYSKMLSQTIQQKKQTGISFITDCEQINKAIANKQK